MSDKVVPKDSYKVFSTTNYKLFKIAIWNRDPKHVKVIKESIMENGFLMVPILVNESMEIIDGQGRFYALRELGLPVYYIVQNGLRREHCIALNYKQTNWGTSDYVKCYAIESNDYKYLQDIMKQFKSMPVWLCAIAATDTQWSGNILDRIRSGKFVCSDSQYIKAIGRLSFLNDLNDKIKDIEGRTQYMYQALLFCYNCEEIDNEKLAKKFKKNAYTIDGVANVEGAIKHIERIYNKGDKAANYTDICGLYKKAVREKRQ